MKHLLRGLAVLGLALAGIGGARAAELTDDTVLLSRGGITVTYGDWRGYLRSIPEDVLEKGEGNPAMLARFLDSLWTWTVLAAEARAAGLDQDPVVQARVRYRADRALGRAWLDEAERTAPAADFEAQAREHWLLNPEEFTLPDQAHVSHILISTEERSPEEAEARAREVRVLAVSGEQDFADLAREYSDDSAAAAGGDLGPQVPSQWVPAFREAVLAMQEPGAISEPVQTRFGYHIIRLQAWIPGEVIPFETARPELMAHFQRQNRARWRQRRVEAAQDMTGRELNVEALRDIMNLGETDPGQVFDAAAGKTQTENGD